jgi:hypothetical protein
MSHDGSVSRQPVRDKVRRLPAGNFIVRTAIFLLGASFIALGVALVALPGPLTIPPILLGLAIWSLEFEFAQAWLDKAKVPAQKAWEEAKLHPWRTGLVSGGGMILAVVAAVLAARYGLIDRARDLVT